MEYAIHILAIVALLFGLIAYRRRKVKKPVYRHYSVRSTLPADGDPFEDRIEFHMSKRVE